MASPLMKYKLEVVIHEAEEGGYWAEIPAIPGCATQGETLEEVRQNITEAAQGCLLGGGEDDGGGVAVEVS